MALSIDEWHKNAIKSNTISHEFYYWTKCYMSHSRTTAAVWKDKHSNVCQSLNENSASRRAMSEWNLSNGHSIIEIIVKCTQSGRTELKHLEFHWRFYLFIEILIGNLNVRLIFMRARASTSALFGRNNILYLNRNIRTQRRKHSKCVRWQGREREKCSSCVLCSFHG